MPSNLSRYSTISMRGNDLAYHSPTLGESRDSGTSDSWCPDGSAENYGLQCSYAQALRPCTRNSLKDRTALEAVLRSLVMSDHLEKM
jgi:hypothetical protein